MRAFKVAAATVGLSAALTGTAVGLAGPVNAAPGSGGCTNGSYPPANSTVAMSRSRASVGMTISYQARCFKPGEKVTATVFSTPRVVGTPTADKQGTVSGSFTVTSDLKPGRHTLELAAATGTQSASFIVVPSAAAAGTSASTDNGSLAFTGSDAAKTAGAGFVLLLGGGALIVAAKRRKHANAAA
ncbi:hypothetical protein SAMN05216199_3402 [Pedococcus cremeus]|uniref:Gram-positive cocci surface proteins LPxTG domain-containing protein n=1 Tax=Pedococcus cremeus TaxID=587636 RepID=A0A1H9X353_9MICO|nr:hypothetical protein [Pedococcus cremeus]SES40622.1 hypothetical protein SAMN05216199_3402 [Pedococcus cremeus]